MTGKQKGGRNSSNKSERNSSNKSEKNAAEASIADNIPKKGTNNMAASSGVTLKTAETSRNSQASATISPNMAEKPREKRDSVNSRKVTFGAMESDVGVSKNKAKNTTGKDSYNLASLSQEAAFSAEKSRKTNARGRGKSAPSTSRTETFATAEHKGRKLDPSIQKLINDRISVLEPKANEAKKIESGQEYKFRFPQELDTGDGNVQVSSKEKVVFVPDNESKTRVFIKTGVKGIRISGYIPKAARSAGNSRESASPPQNMVEKKQGGNDNVKSTCVVHAENQKDMQEKPKNKNENTTGMESDNLPSLSQEVALPPQKRQKKKKKSRGKSTPSSSGIESLASAKSEGHNLDCSNTFVDKDVDVKESLNARVSSIESVKTEQKSNECIQKYKIESSSQEEKGKMTFNIGDENLESSSKENQVTISDNDSKTDYSVRPFIFLTDKSTQTDPLQEPSESTVMAEATEQHFNICKEFGSNLTPLFQNLRSFKEEFLSDVKIASDNFEEGLLKCLKDEKRLA